ncbi:unnamed protein product [Caenorhabditis angaria]|uniref:Origin recognition complex subunit 5 C-terminal domain-containing protein n=1 Tax=Caenorhabditis angaria TaxID=860376 RepID=A0A9P1IPV3_9PELO|nr:unnamed protein product [Caenorhabditis angaria]
MMDSQDIIRLRALLFNDSKSIGHVHVFGENGSGRSEIIRQIIRESDESWICTAGDFLYADGNMKLLLESLAKDMNFKTRGDKIEEFFCNLYESVEWPNPKRRKVLIFLDNAQAVVNFSSPILRCFFNSYKCISNMTVRFVTSAPSEWITYQTNIAIGHSPIPHFHIKSPNVEQCSQLISNALPNVPKQFIRFAVDLLFAHCKSPNTILQIISTAFSNYGEREKFEANRAGDCIKKAADYKLGLLCNKNQESTTSSDIIHSFESMPTSMRYLLVAAYCASNNSALTDRRFFVKNHGRDKRSEQKELRAEVNRQLRDLEPKAADLQRIVCIYESLVILHNDRSIRGFDVKNVASFFF